MALVKTALPATLPASQRKTLANASVPVLMGAGIFRDSVTADSLVAPRDLIATPTLAMTGLGVGASPLSIVQGLITLAVRHAHGNQIDGAENLPPAARIGLQATLACLKKGAGCRLPQLEQAAKAGVEAMLALPAPSPAKRVAAAPAPAAELAAAGEPAPTTTTTTEPAAAGEPAPATTTTTEPTTTTTTPEEWLERSSLLAEKTASICAEAEKAIPSEIDTAGMVEVISKRDDAQDVLRALAKQLGYRLVLSHKKAA